MANIQKYLLLYRSTPQATMGVSPAKLLFDWKVRTTLPLLQDYNVDDTEVCDCYSENKQKGKIYSDNKPGTHDSEISPGDKVLVCQEKENKLLTTFRPSHLKL